MVRCEDPVLSQTRGHSEYTLKLQYAGPGAWVLARETGSGCGEEAYECRVLGMVCSDLTAAQGGPRTDKETEVQGGWTTLSGPPREGQGPGRHHGPNQWPAWFCARGTLMPTESHGMRQNGGRQQSGGCKAGVVLAWALQHLVSSGPGLRPALAWRSRRRPHLGSQPESASSPGNSHLPPLPGLGPASTHIPTQGSSPTLQIS